MVGCYTTPDGSIVPTDSWNPNPIPNKKPKRPPTVGDNVNVRSRRRYDVARKQTPLHAVHRILI